MLVSFIEIHRKLGNITILRVNSYYKRLFFLEVLNLLVYSYLVLSQEIDFKGDSMHETSHSCELWRELTYTALPLLCKEAVSVA